MGIPNYRCAMSKIKMETPKLNTVQFKDMISRRVVDEFKNVFEFSDKSFSVKSHIALCIKGEGTVLYPIEGMIVKIVIQEEENHEN